MAQTIGVVHVHSNYSRDGRDSLERLRDLAVARGLRFVAMTDHAEDFDAARFEAFTAHCQAVSGPTISIVPGLEFRFTGYTGLHLLAMGLRQWIEPRTPREFADLAPSVCGLTMVAHPILARYRVPTEIMNTIDAIEVWNASYNTRYLPDPRALALLRALRVARPAVVGVAGLDQHDASNDRGTRVVLARESAADPLAEMRAGRFRNRGWTLTFGPRADWPPAGMAALTVVRSTFDAIERTHERLMRMRKLARQRAG
jgi:hypothetical protein